MLRATRHLTGFVDRNYVCQKGSGQTGLISSLRSTTPDHEGNIGSLCVGRSRKQEESRRLMGLLGLRGSPVSGGVDGFSVAAFSFVL